MPGRDRYRPQRREQGARDEAIGSERRLREAGEFRLAEAWKAAVRDERDAREGEVAQISCDLVALKTQLNVEDRKREDEHSQQHRALQKMRTDIAGVKHEQALNHKLACKSDDQPFKRQDSINASLETLDARVVAHGDVLEKMCVMMAHRDKQLLERALDSARIYYTAGR